MNIRHDLVTCYIVRRAIFGDQILQLRRAAGDYLGGTWQTVSGQVEPGETAWQAAVRETLEESGLTPIEFFRLPVVNTFYIPEGDNLFHAVLFCAIVETDATVRINGEHDAFRWIDRNQIEQHFMWASDRSAIAELCKTILDDGLAKPYLRIALPDRPSSESSLT